MKWSQPNNTSKHNYLDKKYSNYAKEHFREKF